MSSLHPLPDAIDLRSDTVTRPTPQMLEAMARAPLGDDGLDGDPDAAGIEADADRFARDFLIDPTKWSDFCAEGQFTASSVKRFARSIGIAPFIVVGRLQRERRIAYSRLTGLKPRYEWTTASGP